MNFFVWAILLCHMVTTLSVNKKFYEDDDHVKLFYKYLNSANLLLQKMNKNGLSHPSSQVFTSSHQSATYPFHGQSNTVSISPVGTSVTYPPDITSVTYPGGIPHTHPHVTDVTSVTYPGGIPHTDPPGTSQTHPLQEHQSGGVKLKTWHYIAIAIGAVILAVLLLFLCIGCCCSSHYF